MTSERSIYRALCCCLIAAVALTAAGSARGDDVLLISNDLQVRRVNLASMEADRLMIVGPGDRKQIIAGGEFIALAFSDVSPRLPKTGLLVLADGQRLPGEAVAEESGDNGDSLAWRHPWLGRIEVPLDDIASVRFRPGAPLPQPAEADAVLLANGDRLEGFIASLNDPVLLEVGDGREVRLLEIPRRSVSSIRMVTPQQQPRHMRAWLADGTIVDVRSIETDDSGRVRMTTTWHAADAAPTRLMIVELAAILLDAARLMPMASLQPQRVEGPETRYEVPPPRVLEDEAAVLGLSPIEFRGPLAVHYMLPRGTKRFAAEAVLPESARTWGDCELIVSDRTGERFRQRMHAADPVAMINIELADTPHAPELTIELREGTYGGIQDQLILRRPMLLVDQTR